LPRGIQRGDRGEKFPRELLAIRSILEHRVTGAIIRGGKVGREQRGKKFDNFDASGLDARPPEMMHQKPKVPRRNDGGIGS